MHMCNYSWVAFRIFHYLRSSDVAEIRRANANRQDIDKAMDLVKMRLDEEVTFPDNTFLTKRTKVQLYGSSTT